MGLYEDELHTVLKGSVTEQTIQDLRNRLQTKDEASGEYHPDKDRLEKELDNAEVRVDGATGEPWSAHTTNQVPFVLVGADPAYKLREGGRLCDIVPTLIELMGLEKPKEMTGESLLVK